MNLRLRTILETGAATLAGDWVNGFTRRTLYIVRTTTLARFLVEEEWIRAEDVFIASTFTPFRVYDFRGFTVDVL